MKLRPTFSECASLRNEERNGVSDEKEYARTQGEREEREESTQQALPLTLSEAKRTRVLSTRFVSVSTSLRFPTALSIACSTSCERRSRLLVYGCHR